MVLLVVELIVGVVVVVVVISVVIVDVGNGKKKTRMTVYTVPIYSYSSQIEIINIGKIQQNTAITKQTFVFDIHTLPRTQCVNRSRDIWYVETLSCFIPSLDLLFLD